MGHRASSNLFRLGRQRTWNSQWFAKFEYTYLVSLDYRIRDFIDYIFYNLKWPSSELRIKRFVSRNVLLEVVLVIPTEKVVQYLDSIHFYKMRASDIRVDPYKFYTLAADFNYIVWKMSYSVLSRPVFYLLMRSLREAYNYTKMLSISTYTDLFSITRSSSHRRLRNRYYFFYRRLSSKNLFDKLLLQMVPARIGTYKRKLSSTFKNTNSLRRFKKSVDLKRSTNAKMVYGSAVISKKLSVKPQVDVGQQSSVKQVVSNQNSIGRVTTKPINAPQTHTKVTHSLSFVGKASHEKKSFFGDDFFNVVPYTDKRYISTNVRGASGYKYHDRKRFIGGNRTVPLYNNTSNRKNRLGPIYRLAQRNSGLQWRKKVGSVLNKHCGVLSLVTGLRRRVKYLVGNIASVLLISNNLLGIGSIRRYLLFLKYMRVLRGRFKYRFARSKNRKPFKGSGTKLIANRKQFLSSYKYHRYTKVGTLSRYYRHYTGQSYYPLLYTNKLLPNSRIKRFSFDSRILRRDELLKRYTGHMLELYLLNNSLFRKKFNFNNRIPSDLNWRSISSWLVRSLHGCTKYSYSTIKRSRFVRAIVRLLKNKIISNCRNKNGRISRVRRKLNLKKKLVAFSSAIQNVTTIESLYCRIKTRPVCKSLKFFFSFNDMWYFYSGIHWWYKMLLVVKDRKLVNYNSFGVVYANFYYLILSHKFVNYFNFFKFENLIHTPLKFLRYYKKFIICENAHFNFFRSVRKTTLFMLHMYVYFTRRFTYIQSFLGNLIGCVNSISHGYLDIALYQQHICTFLFLYHFINHLKFISIAVRIIQLANIFEYCDQVVFFFCKVFSILHFVKPIKYLIDVPYYFFCFSKAVYIKHKPYNANNPPRLRVRDRSQDRDKGLCHVKLFNAEFLIDRKEDVILGRPYLEDLYLVSRKLQMLHISLLSVLGMCSFGIFADSNFNFMCNTSFIQLFKMFPTIIKYPYFLLKRGSSVCLKYKDIAMNGKYLKCVPKYIASAQFNKLLSKRHAFFFRFVVDKLLLRLDVLRRDILPAPALRFLSNIIEYNLSKYLSNKVLFLPIYYLGKKLPLKHARIVCLYLSYELEKGMPYFLVMKNLGFISNYVSRYPKKRYFKSFRSVFFYGITKLDKYLMNGNSSEFNRYRLSLQSKSVMKYYLFRTFHSISLFRGFTRRVGIRISCSGRVHRRNTRSHTMWFTRGSMPLRIFDRYIDYYSAHAVTHLGTIGIKTWIYLTQFISLGG